MSTDATSAQPAQWHEGSMLDKGTTAGEAAVSDKPWWVKVPIDCVAGITGSILKAGVSRYGTVLLPRPSNQPATSLMLRKYTPMVQLGFYIFMRFTGIKAYLHFRSLAISIYPYYNITTQDSTSPPSSGTVLYKPFPPPHLVPRLGPDRLLRPCINFPDHSFHPLP